MSSRQRYSPVSPIDTTFRQNSDGTLRDGRESIELKDVHRERKSETPLAPTPPSSSGLPPPYSKIFKSDEQTWKLFYPQFWRWLGTVAFVALIVVTLKIFQDKGNFSHNSKYLFNTIITGLSLGLGLNFFVSLQIVLDGRLIGH